MELVFCDLDGTLINSEQERINTYFLALNECNYKNYIIPPIQNLLGNSERNNLLLIAPYLSKNQIHNVITARKKYLETLDISKIKINHNVFQTVSKYKKIVVVTNSSFKYANRMINKLLKIPCEIIALEEGMPAKPDPFLYKLAFKKFAKKNIKVVFEDSKPGIDAAEKAGANIIYKVIENNLIELYKKDILNH